jgi:hypothetical protein
MLAAAAALVASPAAAAADANHPLRFFEGLTEGSGAMRIVLKKSYRTLTIGRGRIERDGSLTLVQRVSDEGRPPRERRWRIRQTGPRHFTGSMSEAVGPITIDEVGGRFRFRFKMKGNLSVEQWLAPLAGGNSARNSLTVRKFGMTVGTADGTIVKLAGR